MLGKIDGKRRRGQLRMRWLDGFTELMDRNFEQLQEIVKESGGWHAAACQGTDLDTTQ